MTLLSHPLPERKSSQVKRSKILLHTSLGLKVFRGYDRHHVGVPFFGKLLRNIWQASKQDDPYADLFLLRAYDVIVRTRRELKAQDLKYQEHLQAEMGAELNKVVEESPVVIPVNFSTPYAYIAAYLIIDFDRLVRTLLQLEHHGVMKKQKIMPIIHSFTRQMRQILSEPLQWIPTGVTREDIKLNTEKAQVAFAKMGEISEVIISKRIKPPYSPRSVSP